MKKTFLNSALLILLALVVSCAPARDLSNAPSGDQNIVLWHRQSGERIDVTTRRNGQYNKEAFEQIDHIFRDRHTGEEYPIDPKLIDLIAYLRDKLLMSPNDPIELLSGYRSPESNAKLATINKYVAKNSFHMKGQAADIRIPDMNSSALEAVAKTIQKGGVALYPDSGHVHVDTGPVRGWSVIRGKEAGLKESRSRSSDTASSGTSSSSITPFAAPRNRHNAIEQRIGKPIRVKPINSYDDLPEPTAPAHAKILPAVTPKPASKIISGSTVKTKTGTPVHTTAPKATPKTTAKPAAKAPAQKTPAQKTPAQKTLNDAKKQWVKTPYHGGVQGGVKSPAKPAAQKPAAKKPVKKDE